MKRFFIVIYFIVIHFSVFSQVGIGTINPNPHAELEIHSNEKGVLIPRIAIQDTRDTSSFNTSLGPLPESLLIYNTNRSADVVEGYYYWFDNYWHKIATDTVTYRRHDLISPTDLEITGGQGAVLNEVSLSIKDAAVTENKIKGGASGEVLTTDILGNAVWSEPGDSSKWIYTDPANPSTSAIYRAGKVEIRSNGVPDNSSLLDVELDAVINGLTIGRGGGNIESNMVIGIEALGNNSSGTFNTAQGYNALYTNTGGSYNTASGAHYTPYIEMYKVNKYKKG